MTLHKVSLLTSFHKSESWDPERVTTNLFIVLHHAYSVLGAVLCFIWELTNLLNNHEIFIAFLIGGGKTEHWERLDNPSVRVLVCANLTGSQSVSKSGEASPLGVSMKVFLDEISILKGRQSEADSPPQYGWASVNPLRAWVEQKNRRENLTFSVWLVELERWSFSCPLTETYPIDSHGSQTFRLGLNDATSVPRPLACRQQITDFSE